MYWRTSVTVEVDARLSAIASCRKPSAVIARVFRPAAVNSTMIVRALPLHQLHARPRAGLRGEGARGKGARSTAPRYETYARLWADLA
jgi:hypothetical protein